MPSTCCHRSPNETSTICTVRRPRTPCTPVDEHAARTRYFLASLPGRSALHRLCTARSSRASSTSTSVAHERCRPARAPRAVRRNCRKLQFTNSSNYLLMKNPVVSSPCFMEGEQDRNNQEFLPNRTPPVGPFFSGSVDFPYGDIPMHLRFYSRVHLGPTNIQSHVTDSIGNQR